MQNKNFKLIMENWRQFKRKVILEQETETVTNERIKQLADEYAKAPEAEDEIAWQDLKDAWEKRPKTDNFDIQQARWNLVRLTNSDTISWTLAEAGALEPGAEDLELAGADEGKFDPKGDIVKANLSDEALALPWAASNKQGFVRMPDGAIKPKGETNVSEREAYKQTIIDWFAEKKEWSDVYEAADATQDPKIIARRDILARWSDEEAFLNWALGDSDNNPDKKTTGGDERYASDISSSLAVVQRVLAQADLKAPELVKYILALQTAKPNDSEQGNNEQGDNEQGDGQQGDGQQGDGQQGDGQPQPADGDLAGVLEKVKKGTWKSGGKAFPNADPNIVAKVWELQKLIGATPDGVFGNETSRAIRKKYYGK